MSDYVDQLIEAFVEAIGPGMERDLLLILVAIVLAGVVGFFVLVTSAA